jgi:hypothetical protein
MVSQWSLHISSCPEVFIAIEVLHAKTFYRL